MRQSGRPRTMEVMQQRGRFSSVSIVSLDLAPEDTLCMPVLSSGSGGKTKGMTKACSGDSLSSTSYGSTTYLLPAILPSHEGYLLSNFYLNYIFKLNHKQVFICFWFLLPTLIFPIFCPKLDLQKTGLSTFSHEKGRRSSWGPTLQCQTMSYWYRLGEKRSFTSGVHSLVCQQALTYRRKALFKLHG